MKSYERPTLVLREAITAIVSVAVSVAPAKVG